MVDLLYPPADVPASLNFPDSVKEGTIAQAILRFMPHSLLPQSGISQGTPVQIKAMQALVKVITELRQLIQEGTVKQPQTPKGLAPYIEAEVQSVINALQAQPDLSYRPATSCSEALLGQEHLELKTIASWLLWGIARSSHQVMQLLEGSIAQLPQPKQAPQTGMIRLVALLEFKLPKQTYSLDLATHSLAPTLLPPERLVQLPNAVLANKPRSVGDFLQDLTTQIQDSTPTICSFFAGLPVEMLIPGYPWKEGKLRLHLGLEFVPQAPAVQVSDLPIVQITNSDWASQYTDTIAQQELAHLFPQLPSIQSWQQNQQSISTSDWQISLITDACDVTEWLQRSLTFSSRAFVPEALGFEDLTLRLLWCFSRSSYAVMQWMSGVSVQLLEPESPWVTGILRYVVKLQASTPAIDWRTDLITRQPFASEVLAINSEAIVRSLDLTRTPCLRQLAHLEAEILQTIEQTAPELQHLFQGVEVDLQGPDGEWQPGILRLEAGFSFSPA